MLIGKLKSLLGMKVNGDDTPVANLDSMATKGLKLGDYAKVDYPMLEIEEDFLFKLGTSSKKITGVSFSEERGDSTYRFYTEDEYFFQVDFFGENKAENLKSIALFHYQFDDSEKVDANDAESVDAWRKIIEHDETFMFDGKTYKRDAANLGGLEVVDVEGGSQNAIENTFGVFSREVSKDIFEFIIVNMEQEVEVNGYGDAINRGDLLATIALGVTTPHAQLSVIRK